MKYLIVMMLILCLAYSCGATSEKYDRARHTPAYNNFAEAMMCEAPENYSEETVAEILLSHLEQGGKENSPIAIEAKDVLREIHGTIGEREMLPNGWSTSRRSYNDQR